MCRLLENLFHSSGGDGIEARVSRPPLERPICLGAQCLPSQYSPFWTRCYEERICQVWDGGTTEARTEVRTKDPATEGRMEDPATEGRTEQRMVGPNDGGQRPDEGPMPEYKRRSPFPLLRDTGSTTNSPSQRRCTKSTESTNTSHDEQTTTMHNLDRFQHCTESFPFVASQGCRFSYFPRHRHTCPPCFLRNLILAG